MKSSACETIDTELEDAGAFFVELRHPQECLGGELAGDRGLVARA